MNQEPATAEKKLNAPSNDAVSLTAVSPVQPELFSEEDERHWRVTKIKAELAELNRSFFRRPSAWIPILLPALGLCVSLAANVGQWRSADEHRQKAEIAMERAQISKDLAQVQQLKAENEHVRYQGLLAELKKDTQARQEELGEIESQLTDRKKQVSFLEKQRAAITTSLSDLEKELEILVTENPSLKEPITGAIAKTKEIMSVSEEAYLSERPRNTLLFKVLGEPGKSIVKLDLPYPLTIAWDSKAVIKTLSLHQDAEPYFKKAFLNIVTAGLEDEARYFGGLLNVRKMRGGNTWSNHSWGIEIDLNPDTNPMRGQGDMDPRVVAAFENAGFVWGGRYGDPMSFCLSTTTIRKIAAEKGITLDFKDFR